MNIPVATYRLQFSPSFTFEDAADVLGYLKALGISHVYSSPIFDARLESSHGSPGPRDVSSPPSSAYDKVCARQQTGGVRDILEGTLMPAVGKGSES